MATFAEKLAELTKVKGKAKVARAAGLSPATITDYLQRGNIPRADNALALARALGVPLDWLVDDTRNLPAPSIEKPSTHQLSDTEVIREFCRRFRLRMVEHWHELKQAEAVDWARVAAAVLAVPGGQPLPRDERNEMKLIEQLEQLVLDNSRFNPSIASYTFHSELPGHDLAEDELTSESLMQRWRRLRDFTAFGALGEYAAMRRVKWKEHDQKWFEKRRRELLGTVLKLPAGDAHGRRVDTSPPSALDSPRSSSGRKRKA